MKLQIFYFMIIFKLFILYVINKFDIVARNFHITKFSSSLKQSAKYLVFLIKGEVNNEGSLILAFHDYTIDLFKISVVYFNDIG